MIFNRCYISYFANQNNRKTAISLPFFHAKLLLYALFFLLLPMKATHDDKTQRKKNVKVVDKNVLLQEKNKLVEDYDNLLNEKNNLLNEKNKLVEDYDNLLNQKNNLVNDYDNLLNEKEQLNNKLKEYMNNHKFLTDELTTLKGKMDDYLSKEPSENQQENEIILWLKWINNQTFKNRIYSKEEYLAKQQEANLTGLEKDELIEQVNLLTNQNNVYKKEYNDLESDYSNLKLLVRELKNQKLDYENHVDKLENYINILKNDKNAPKNDKNELENDKNELKNDKNELENYINGFEEYINKSKNDKTELKKYKTKFENYINELKKYKTKLEKYKTKLEDYINELEKEKTKLGNDKTRLEKEKTKLENYINTLKNDKTKLEKEKTKLKNDKTKLGNNINTLKYEISQALNENTKLKKQVLSLNTKIQTLQTTTTTTNQELEARYIKLNSSRINTNQSEDGTFISPLTNQNDDDAYDDDAYDDDAYDDDAYVDFEDDDFDLNFAGSINYDRQELINSLVELVVDHNFKLENLLKTYQSVYNKVYYTEDDLSAKKLGKDVANEQGQRKESFLYYYIVPYLNRYLIDWGESNQDDDKLQKIKRIAVKNAYRSAFMDSYQKTMNSEIDNADENESKSDGGQSSYQIMKIKDKINSLRKDANYIIKQKKEKKNESQEMNELKKKQKDLNQKLTNEKRKYETLSLNSIKELKLCENEKQREINEYKKIIKEKNIEINNLKNEVKSESANYLKKINKANEKANISLNKTKKELQRHRNLLKNARKETEREENEIINNYKRCLDQREKELIDEKAKYLLVQNKLKTELKKLNKAKKKQQKKIKDAKKKQEKLLNGKIKELNLKIKELTVKISEKGKFQNENTSLKTQLNRLQISKQELANKHTKIAASMNIEHKREREKLQNELNKLKNSIESASDKDLKNQKKIQELMLERIKLQKSLQEKNQNTTKIKKSIDTLNQKINSEKNQESKLENELENLKRKMEDMEKQQKEQIKEVENKYKQEKNNLKKKLEAIKMKIDTDDQGKSLLVEEHKRKAVEAAKKEKILNEQIKELQKELEDKKNLVNKIDAQAAEDTLRRKLKNIFELEKLFMKREFTEENEKNKKIQEQQKREIIELQSKIELCNNKLAIKKINDTPNPHEKGKMVDRFMFRSRIEIVNLKKKIRRLNEEIKEKDKKINELGNITSTPTSPPKPAPVNYRYLFFEMLEKVNNFTTCVPSSWKLQKVVSLSKVAQDAILNIHIQKENDDKQYHTITKKMLPTTLQQTIQQLTDQVPAQNVVIPPPGIKSKMPEPVIISKKELIEPKNNLMFNCNSTASKVFWGFGMGAFGVELIDLSIPILRKLLVKLFGKSKKVKSPAKRQKSSIPRTTRRPLTTS